MNNHSHIYKVSPEELRKRQSWPLDEKIRWFVYRYIDFAEVFGLHNVYCCYSGGKDSDVMCDIIDKLHAGEFAHLIGREYEFLYHMVIKGHPSPVKAFCNTGLEFPEIVSHVRKRYPKAVILKPEMGFTRFIREQGVAVGSKKIAMQIRKLKRYISNPSPKTEVTKRHYLTGIRGDGQKGKWKVPAKWLRLLNAPFNVTEKCCDNFKKDPFLRYQKKTGKKPIVGTTAAETQLRALGYLKSGCITFTKGRERCRPLSIFLAKDIWEYSKKYGLRFCEVYYDREVEVEQPDGSKLMEWIEGETSTGCTFCAFGLHLEPKDKPNRIQRLAKSHPKYYDIVINKCGFRDVLEWLDIAYKPFKGIACSLASPAPA